MGKLQNREIYRHGNYIFLILHYTEGFTVRVIGTDNDTEHYFRSNEQVNSFIESYNN